METRLTVLDRIPDELLDRSADQLAEVLPGPTLIHLEGRQPQPLFVSVLQHGNEFTGWEAARALLSAYAGKQLPRSLSLFIANIGAAQQRLRTTAGQVDFNRSWPGGVRMDTDINRVLRQVSDAMRARHPFASVDIHNTSGLNPHYSAITRIANRMFHLATMFARTVVYYTRPPGTQAACFSEFCPAVVLECGQAGQARGENHARDYLDACLHMAEIPAHPVASHDIDLFRTVATVRVNEGVSFGFGECAADICFEADLDHMNFHELPAGTSFGTSGNGESAPIVAVDDFGTDITQDLFEIVDGEIRTKRILMPSMLTLDAQIVRQDCLCYVMERMTINTGHHHPEALS
ncbi:MAG: peptidase M14 [Gammaproteobacteria bacterium]|nr:MAG: peptidase M14 [Gammaproteobacteria bacterium]